MSVCGIGQPTNVKEEDIDGTAMDDVDGIPLEELDGTPLDGEPMKDKADDDINGVPLKSIVPYGDDIDGEPGSTAIVNHQFSHSSSVIISQSQYDLKQRLLEGHCLISLFAT